MKEYTISYTWQGYEISKKDEHGRNLYLRKLYKGKAIFVTDYLYSKKYATINSATKAIQAIVESR